MTAKRMINRGGTARLREIRRLEDGRKNGGFPTCGDRPPERNTGTGTNCEIQFAFTWSRPDRSRKQEKHSPTHGLRAAETLRTDHERTALPHIRKHGRTGAAGTPHRKTRSSPEGRDAEPRYSRMFTASSAHLRSASSAFLMLLPGNAPPFPNTAFGHASRISFSQRAMPPPP